MMTHSMADALSSRNAMTAKLDRELKMTLHKTSAGAPCEITLVEGVRRVLGTLNVKIVNQWVKEDSSILFCTIDDEYDTLIEYANATSADDTQWLVVLRALCLGLREKEQKEFSNGQHRTS